jgi:nucleoside-diphosphate-sugar epimerase
VKTALVTGSSGFVGRHMAAALDARGYLVHRVDIAERDYPVDCRDTFTLEWSPLRPRFDLVVHCAAMIDGREAIENKAALLGAYNLQLDGALFEWALRARPGRIVYFSSSAAYPVRLQSGSYVGHRLQERDLGGDPDATYGWVKLTGERIAQEVRAAGIPVTIVRPFSGYGEDQDDCYPFPAMIARALNHESPFRVWGDGQQVRDFVHIDDIVGAVLALVDQGVDGPVNLGTGRPTSMDGLARMAMRTAGYEAPILHMSDKPSGVQYRVADPTLLNRYYEPETSIEWGVDSAINFGRERTAA